VTPARVVVVGLVRGAAVARDLQKAPDFEVVGIVDLDEEKLARVGDEIGVPAEGRYADLAPALEAEADVVFLALPTPLHLEASMQALAAGRHVVCEKPLAPSLEDARALRAAVDRGSSRFMVGEQYRFAEGIENLRRAVAEGLVGKVAYLDHDFRRATPANRRPAGHWSDDPDSPIAEMSVHHFDIWWYVTGQRPVEVRADGFNPEWNPPGRRFGFSMHATLEGGAHVHYLTSRALARPQTSWYGDLWVVGEEGALFWDGNGAAVTHHRSLPTHDYREQHLARGPVSYVDRGGESIQSATVTMVRELVEAIREGRRHKCDLRDNWPSFATAMAARESARTGAPVKVAAE
jgi:predicted dehydrogenase